MNFIINTIDEFLHMHDDVNSSIYPLATESPPSAAIITRSWNVEKKAGLGAALGEVL